MAQLAPPPMPPRVAVADHDGLDRVHFRLWQIMVTAVTVLLTVWCFTLGPILGIIALMVAKHVLVAVLVMGMDVQALDRAPDRNSG
jgi:hypothetical protein